MADKISKEVLKQIDKAVNSDRKLGTLGISEPINLNFVDYDSQKNVAGTVPIVWRKRQFEHDKGLYFNLGEKDFAGYGGNMTKSSINTIDGTFSDVLVNDNSCVHYSCNVYSKKTARVTLYITVDNANVALYAGSTGTTFYFGRRGSTTAPFISGPHTIQLATGWNAINIYVYKQDVGTNGTPLEVRGEIGNYITAYRMPDWEPPSAPEWIAGGGDHEPLECEYINPRYSAAMRNVLRWKNAQKYRADEYVKGYEVRRRQEVPIEEESSPLSNLTVVSGWGDYQFIVSGDRTLYFPIESTLTVGSGATEYTVSGTEYFVTRGNPGQTFVTLNQVYWENDDEDDPPVELTKWVHVFDKELDGTEPYIISGTDTEIEAGKTYQYRIYAYDDSPYKNFSAPSAIKTVTTGDTTAPSKPTNVSAKGVDEGILLRWTGAPEEDVAGYKIWRSANPTPKEDWPITIPLSYYESLPRDNRLSYFITTYSEANGTEEAQEVVPRKLENNTEYNFYVSSYDRWGNETLTDLNGTASTTNMDRNSRPVGDVNRRIQIDGTNNAINFYEDGNNLVLKMGALDTSHGVTSGTGLAVGRYVENQPNMVYDSAAGSMKFNIGTIPYMGLEYNDDSPRMWIGSGINSVEVTGDGLDVGISGYIQGGATGYNAGTGFWEGYDSGAYKFFVGDASGDKVTWDGSNLNIVGDLSVGTTAGGFIITDTQIRTSDNSIILDSSDKRIVLSGTDNDADYGSAGVQIEYNAGTPRFYFGDGSDQYLEYNGTTLTINGMLITGIQQGSEASIQGWRTNITFSSSDYNTVAWTTGDIVLMDGTTYSITPAANTGNMAATTYIYLDNNVSDAVLQTTTTPSTAVGAGKILICTATPGDANDEAMFVVFGENPYVNSVGIAAGAVKETTIRDDSISTAKVQANAITATEIAAATITASQIAAGTILASNIAANEITANEIASNTITAAEIDTGAITADELAANSVYANAIQGYVITGDKVAANTISGGNIVANSITVADVDSDFTDRMFDSADASNYIQAWRTATTNIDGNFLNALSVDSASLAAEVTDRMFTTSAVQSAIENWMYDATYIDGGLVATSTILANQIGLFAIDGDRIAGTTISGGNIITNTITATQIDAGTITATEMAADSITVGNMDSATAARIFSTGAIKGAIEDWMYDTTYMDGSFIATSTILANQIGLYAIDGDRIAATTISGGNILTSTITADHINVSSLSSLSADMGSITAGNITLNTLGYIRAGLSSYTDNTTHGFWLGNDSGWKFTLGEISSLNYISWTGAELQVRGTLNADDINAGTITGRTIQTGTSGQRMIISGNDNTMRFFDDNDVEIIKIDDNLTFYDLQGYPGYPGIQVQDGGYAARSDDFYFGASPPYYAGTETFMVPGSVQILTASGTFVQSKSFAVQNLDVTDQDNFGVWSYMQPDPNKNTTFTRNRYAGYFEVDSDAGHSNITGYGIYAKAVAQGGAYAAWFDDGDVYAKQGIIIGTDQDANHIDDSSHGAASTTMYIGNETIDTSVSDGRYKVVLSGIYLPVEELDELEVVPYRWTDREDDKLHVGIIAQQAHEVNPAFAREPENEDDGLWKLEKQDILCLSVKAIQDLRTQIRDLRDEIEVLKSQK